MGLRYWLRRRNFHHQSRPSLTRSGKRKPFAKLSVEGLESRLAPATITWTGAGDGTSWTDGNNWSGQAMPGTNDDAVINTGSAATITIQSGNSIHVQSVTTGSNDSLANTGGSLTVTAGTSTLSGPLSMTGGSLTATGSGVDFTANSTTTVSAANLSAQSGATLRLPQLTSYVANGNNFTANGSGSVLDVSALTTLTQQGNWNVFAQNGGEIKLTGMTSLTASGHSIGITDIGRSTLLDSNLTTLTGVSVTLDGSDAQVANGWTTFTGGSLTVRTGSYSLPGLTDVDGATLITQNGGSLTLAGLTSYSANGSYFEATGSGSVLDVSALTTLTQQGNWNLFAQNGGEIKLTGLTSLTASSHSIGITDTGGSTLLDGNLTTLTGVGVTLDGSDAHVADGWTKFTGGNLMVATGSYSLPNLTDLDGTTLIVQNGGSLTLAGLTSYSANGSYFEATGTGSVLDVSALTSLIQQGNWNLFAQNGGEIKLIGMTSLTASSHAIGINDTGGGTLLDSNLITLTGISVTLDGSDAHVANSWTTFTGGNLTLSTGSYSLPNLTDVDGTTLITQNGGTLTLAGLTSYSANGSYLQATGSGSVLDVSALTTLTQQGNWNLLAQNGGEIKLTGMTSLTASSHAIGITDTGGGTIESGSYLTLSGVSVTLDSQSSFQVGTLDLENGSSLSASGTLSANLINGGTVNPGGSNTAGQLTVTGNYTQTAAGTLALDLDGLAAGSQFDQLVVGGNATLGGKLSVKLLGSFSPSLGNTFSILPASNWSGAFASGSGLQLGNGLELDPSVTSSGVTLTTDEPSAPQVTSSTPSGVVTGPISSIDVTFNEAMATAGFTTAQVSLTGPAGAITISSVTALSPTTFQISFSPQTAGGIYSFSVGPAITNLAGNKMDQDGDGSPFGQSDDSYTGTFRLPSPDTWTGGGDGKSWNDPNNWSEDAVPGSNDEAIINVPGLTVNYSGGSSSVNSVVSEANLIIAGGSLTVNGAFILSGGASLTASGTATTFSADGTTTANGTSLYVSSGATLSLPGLTSYSGPPSDAITTLQASGTR